jgi:formate dehydrogenase major subunit
MLIYKLGDGAKNAKNHVIHVEGDPDNPVSRGSLCPKGAGVMDMINSPGRVKYPSVREAGSKEWKRISWDEALTRVAKHMKADRDANFQTKNDAGTTVNRWTTTGFLMCSSSSNESSYLTVKVARGLGMVGIDTQARV